MQLKRPSTLRGWAGVGCASVLVLACGCFGILGAIGSVLPSASQATDAPVALPATAPPDPPCCTPTVAPTVAPTELPSTAAPTERPTQPPPTPNATATAEVAALAAIATEVSVTQTARASAVVPARGMGVTRAAVQAPYEQLGFAFEPAPLADGRERVIASHDIAAVEIIGPVADVQQATVSVALTAGNEGTAARGLIYMGTLINVVAPESEIGPWVVEEMKAATMVLPTKGFYDNEVVQDGRRTRFQALGTNDGVLLLLTIAAE